MSKGPRDSGISMDDSALSAINFDTKSTLNSDNESINVRLLINQFDFKRSSPKLKDMQIQKVQEKDWITEIEPTKDQCDRKHSIQRFDSPNRRQNSKVGTSENILNAQSPSEIAYKNWMTKAEPIKDQFIRNSLIDLEDTNKSRSSR